jgi:hypothetical protein
MLVQVVDAAQRVKRKPHRFFDGWKLVVAPERPEAQLKNENTISLHRFPNLAEVKKVAEETAKVLMAAG